ncbi:MAG TPA: ferritin-like domain-containing protein [Fimbriimonas sp.]|nr:ferritin-like domain-containing protein [Fimbriimonas sp.]
MKNELETLVASGHNGLTRRLLLKASSSGAMLLGAGLLVGCGGSGDSHSHSSSGSKDTDILGAAKIAEALAVTMYTNIINTSPFFATLADDDQSYIKNARDEEMFHYILLRSQTGGTDAPTTYYFPANMFTDPQTTLNVLVTLEDAFVAAYIYGVANFSSSALRVIAAQIMGIESDHRSLARVIAHELGLASTTGLSGSPESVDPPNNNIYERRYGLDTLDAIVNALKPFFDATTANANNFTVSKTFDPTYMPTGAGLFGNPPA